MNQMQTLLRTQKLFRRRDTIDPMLRVALTAPEAREVEDAAVQSLKEVESAMRDSQKETILGV